MKITALVSADQKKDLYEIYLPGLTSKSFRGVSLAELLDDATLFLMETIPKEQIRRMSLYQFCPYVELRKVKVEAEFISVGKEKVKWEGRLPVVVTRWPRDGFYIACLPTISTQFFAVPRTAYLEEGVKHFLQEIAKKEARVEFNDKICRSVEYLEILEVDTDLPTMLPSKPARIRKKKKKKDTQEKKPKRQIVTPTTLREVGLNLSHRAMDGRLKQAFGRDSEVKQILQHLERDGAALLLVGASGVGKTAIIHEVIRQVAQQDLPLHERSDVWEIDGNRLISGMSMVGGWEKRCQEMVSELHQRQDILYVNDLPALVYTGRSAHSDTHVAQYLEPHLARGEFRIIGECTPERLEATREEAPGFFSRFRVIPVGEMTAEQTLMVLVHSMRQLESAEPLSILPETLEGILSLTRRFLVHQSYPGKAVDLLGRLVADYQKVEYDDMGRRKLDRQQLVSFFSRQTGLPPFILWEEQARPSSDINAFFHRRIIAQEAAVSAVTDVVTVLQQGLNDPERPLATMLFVGPTGVGKTETAKALAEYLFGRVDRLIRFDMSEFMDGYSVTRLIGDRHQPEGELTRRIQQQPFSVILLDEIEKGHPSVFDALLQVLGEGRLTNAVGRTVDFCNTVVIMTSNLGVREANRQLGFSEASALQLDSHYRKSAEGFFRPEFFNRIDRIVAFRPLGRDSIAPLVRRLLQEILGRRGLRRSNVLVRIDSDLVELLIDQGFEPQYGARSMKRLLEQRLAVPLARHLVAHSTEQSTLIQLYRFGQEIGMDLWSLEESKLERLPVLKEIRQWEEIRATHFQLTSLLEKIQAEPSLHLLQAQQSALLDRFNQGSLEDVEQERMLLFGELWEELRRLRNELEDFKEEFFSTYHFVHTFDEEVYLHEWDGPMVTQVPTEIPIQLDFQREFPNAQHAIKRIQLDFSSMLYRIQMLLEPLSRPLLLRFLPETDDDANAHWSLQLAVEFALCWQGWASYQGFVLKDGTWEAVPATAWTELAANQRTWRDATSPWRDVRGAAIELLGTGLFQLLKDELGYHIHTFHQGPDRLCHLVRVEEVGSEGVPPLARLSSLDQDLQTWRSLRREGKESLHPLPKLPLRRSFLDFLCEDPQTGEILTTFLPEGPKSSSATIGLSEISAPSPQTDMREIQARLRQSRTSGLPSQVGPIRLSDGLYRVAMLRLLSRVMAN